MDPMTPAPQPEPRSLASELHALVMNTPVKEDSVIVNGLHHSNVKATRLAYKYGHRDARHAIAEAIVGHAGLAAVDVARLAPRPADGQPVTDAEVAELLARAIGPTTGVAALLEARNDLIRVGNALLAARDEAEKPTAPAEALRAELTRLIADCCGDKAGETFCESFGCGTMKRLLGMLSPVPPPHDEPGGGAGEAEQERYFVDERGGCIAVRDREKTDPEYQGLHSNTEGVVWFGMGYTDSGGWGISPQLVAKANRIADAMNSPASAPPPSPAAAQAAVPPSACANCGFFNSNEPLWTGEVCAACRRNGVRPSTLAPPPASEQPAGLGEVAPSARQYGLAGEVSLMRRAAQWLVSQCPDAAIPDWIGIINDESLVPRLRVALARAEQPVAAAAPAAETGEADEQKERWGDALEQIVRWSEAYPIEVFPEPNMAAARAALEAAGLSLDSLSAKSMRHVITGVRKIVDAALAAPSTPEATPAKQGGAS